MPLRLLKCKVTGASVDWITCTSATKGARERLWYVGNCMLHRAKLEGEDTTTWKANGYSGWACGSVSLGARKDGCILRVSGKQAGDEWLECFRASENCSRLDLAVDCQLNSPVTALSRQIYRDAGHMPSVNGRKPMRSLIVSGDGGSTVYIGSRASEQYGRVYDKGIEQKVCQAGSWWRWEVELKGSHAMARAKQLESTDDRGVLLMALVASWFRARAGHSFTSTEVPLKIFFAVTLPSDDRKLRWLAHDVRPTVEKLVRRVGRERVLFALGLLPQSAVLPDVPISSFKDGDVCPQSERFTNTPSAPLTKVS
jgi:DNA relaxase NicK